VLVSHRGAVGCCSQLFRVRSLQLVMTSMRAMARAATTASVFMVYQGNRLRVLLSMWLGSLVGLGDMSPMQFCLLVRLRPSPSLKRLRVGHGEIGNRQTIGHQLILRCLGLVNE